MVLDVAMKINKNITVITVAFNNKQGIVDTLKSISELKTKPVEVIIVDGGSNDGSSSVIDQFKKDISITFLSERDDGIYDAMNKGLLLVKTPLVHYLNSGDLIFGDPYSYPRILPYIIPVKIYYDEANFLFNDYVKFFGFGYCHQGIIFPAPHPKYSINYKIAADFYLITKLFPNGLKHLDFYEKGYAKFFLGGISSGQKNKTNLDIIRISYKNLKIKYSIKIIIIIILKSFFTKNFRRFLLSLSNR